MRLHLTCRRPGYDEGHFKVRTLFLAARLARLLINTVSHLMIVASEPCCLGNYVLRQCAVRQRKGVTNDYPGDISDQIVDRPFSPVEERT